MIYSVIHLYSNIIYEITKKLHYSICNSLYACDRLPLYVIQIVILNDFLKDI